MSTAALFFSYVVIIPVQKQLVQCGSDLINDSDYTENSQFLSTTKGARLLLGKLKSSSEQIFVTRQLETCNCLQRARPRRSKTSAVG